MTRTEAVAWLADRLGDYLAAADREPTDAAGKSLRPVIDEALRMLGFGRADVATAEPDWAGADDDYEAQLEYRALVQIARDLGGSVFNIATGGESFGLYQLRQSVEKDLAAAEKAVVERFGTTGVVELAGGGTDALGTYALDLDFLDDRPARGAWCYGD